MKPTVAVTHWVHPEVRAFLEKHSQVISNDTRESLSPIELRKRAALADGLLVFMPDRIDRTFLETCPNLKVISAALKGYDNFDIDACTERGIWFTIAKDALTIPTAELAIGLLLSLGRKMRDGDDLVRRGRFKGWRPILYGTGLQGSTVGLIGMGCIGQAVAQRLKGFDCQILYSDPHPLTEKEDQFFAAEQTSMHNVLVQSDFIVLSVPYRQATEHLIGTSQMERIKPGSLLINVGRGSVVDEKAIAQALRTGRLGGYAADVFEFEDWARPDRPKEIFPGLLASQLNTLFTPHLGSAIDQVRLDIAMEAARNIVSALHGDRPAGAINTPKPAPLDTIAN